MNKECSHGVSWNFNCLECELVSHKDTVRMFKNKVLYAEKKIKEIENELAKKTTLQARLKALT